MSMGCGKKMTISVDIAMMGTESLLSALNKTREAFCKGITWWLLDTVTIDKFALNITPTCPAAMCPGHPQTNAAPLLTTTVAGDYCVKTSGMVFLSSAKYTCSSQQQMYSLILSWSQINTVLWRMSVWSLKSRMIKEEAKEKDQVCITITQL